MDLEEMLAGFLKDEENLKKVQELAGRLSLPEQTGQAAEQNDDGADLARIMSLISKFKNQGEDNRARLLLALKPILSEERAKRIDGVVRLLKLISLLPLLRESDLLSSFF